MEFETTAVRGFLEPEKHNQSIAAPIYSDTAYAFNSIEHAVNLFDLKEPGNIYSRLANPTNDVLEKRMAALENGIGALAVSSGMAAILTAVMNIAENGDEIVSSAKIYGGTYNLFVKTLKQAGISVKFVKSDDIEEWEKAVSPKTKCLYTETIGNPAINVSDIEALAELAHRRGIPLIADNTVPSPYLCRPADFGADIIVHSTTKYTAGHGSAMGGIIIDAGRFDWAQNDKFPMLTKPDESYHGIIYNKEFGSAAYIAKARAHLIRDLGCCQSPFNSFLTILGLETLHLRMERHSLNALKLAQHLEQHPLIKQVNYPLLESSKYFNLAKKYLKKGASSLVSFRTAADCSKFIESLKIFIHAANLGDVRSIITYPAGTTHRQMTDKQLEEAGISKDFIRISTGIENINDLISDIDSALDAAKP